MYQDVQGSPRAGIPPLLQSWSPVQAVEQVFATLYRTVQDRWERWVAIRQLHNLDDHLLRDLGIERWEIPEIVARQAGAIRR